MVRKLAQKIIELARERRQEKRFGLFEIVCYIAIEQRITIARELGKRNAESVCRQLGIMAFFILKQLVVNVRAGMNGGTSILAQDRKSTRLNSSHSQISYAVFC